MPRSLFFTLIIFSVGMAVSGQLAAEEVYVKDSLRVGVRAEPGNDAAPIAVVTTGMKLDIIERQGEYVKIRMPSGVEGWVKGTYVSDESPAIIKLNELEVQFHALESKLEKQVQHAQAKDLNNKNLSAEIEHLKQENAELRVELQDEVVTSVASGFAYVWKVILVVLVGIIGFALGASWYRKRTMKRLGGLRY